jgi:NADPH-dependent 7-cyano-7-deazaguanine reductase QueF
MILKTIDNPGIAILAKQTHVVEVPALCPKTGNPIAGSTIRISYTPDQRLLEIYSLNEYITSFIGSQEVRDLELLTQVITRDCNEILGVKVYVIGNYILNVGQTIICECESNQ